MNTKKNTVDKIISEGYHLDFGIVFNNALENYKKIAGYAGLGMLLIFTIFFMFLFAIVGLAFGFGSFFQNLSGLNPELLVGSSLLIFLAFTILFSAIFSPVNAGFLRMAKLADHNEDFGLDSLFYYFKTAYFKELFIATLLITTFSSGAALLLQFLEISYVGNLISYTLSFLTFLTIPLIIFSDLKALEAISASIKIVIKQPIVLLGLLIVACIVVALGLVGFCIGIVFTIPFIFSINYSIYREILPLNEIVELDEIGTFKE